MVVPHLDEANRLANLLTGNRTDAEDVVQEACLKALSSLATTVVGNPRAWVMAIVCNTAFTWLARNRPKSIELTDSPRHLERAAARGGDSRTLDPEEALMAAADEATLEGAIRALPSNYREVIFMRDVNGLSYREIAAAIGAPRGTVMSRLARGRALLMDRIRKRT